MKPLLEPVPYTDEDYLILGTRVVRGGAWVYVLLRNSMVADRRDAALMLKLCHSSRVLGRPAARVWVIAVAILELEGHLPV